MRRLTLFLVLAVCLLLAPPLVQAGEMGPMSKPASPLPVLTWSAVTWNEPWRRVNSKSWLIVKIHPFFENPFLKPRPYR